MTIQWLGHACFKITYEGYSVVIDPYDSNFTEGYPKLETTADMVLVSHEHPGHNFREGVKLSGRDESECPFEIESFQVSHDSVGGIMRGFCKVHILKAGGIKLAHLGDIGTQLDGGEITKLMMPDVLMATAGSLTGLPSQEISRIYDEVMATVLIPMHYRDGDRGARRLEMIKDLAGRFEAPEFTEYYDTDTIEITGSEVPRIAVLKFQGGSVRSQFPKFHR